MDDKAGVSRAFFVRFHTEEYARDISDRAFDKNQATLIILPSVRTDITVLQNALMGGVTLYLGICWLVTLGFLLGVPLRNVTAYRRTIIFKSFSQDRTNTCPSFSSFP